MAVNIHDYLIDEQGRIIIEHERDRPPLGDHMASGLLWKVGGGKVYIATGFDKGNRYKHHGRCIPGGRMKRDASDGSSELEIATAAHEILEEVGALKQTKEGLHPLTEHDLVPLCLVKRIEHHRRDKWDESVEETRPWELHQYIFSHCGDLKLHESNDLDVSDPCWMSLPEILAVHEEYASLGGIPSQERTSSEKTRLKELRGVVRKNSKTHEPEEVLHPGKTLYMNHLIVVLLSLRFIGEKFRRLRAIDSSELKNKSDLLFFKAIAREVARDVKNYDAVLDLSHIDPAKTLTEIFRDPSKAKERLKAVRAEELWTDGYFITESE